jgi:hypothetical protein
MFKLNYFCLKLLVISLFLFSFCLPALSQVTYEGREFGPEYFFAIQGEVYGQAAPGVQAVLVNGRQIPLDQNLNYKTNVFLEKGQKYLTIQTRYKGLYFTKKYLVIRHPKVKKAFKLHVPRSEYQKMVSRPPLIPTEKKSEEVLKPEYKVSPDFAAEEFKNRQAIRDLSDAIASDGYGIEPEADRDSVEWLNSILRTPGFYDIWRKKHPHVELTPEIRYLVRATNTYRHKRFEDLSPSQQRNIMLLNRLLLQLTYPDLCPLLRNKPFAGWLGFEFVAQLAADKFLAVRKVDGKYFAFIYDAKTRFWVHLDEISAQELKDLLDEGIIPIYIDYQE